MAPREFMVTATLSGTTRLGVDADWSNPKLIYIKAVMAGAIQNWNNQNPDRAVEAGDSVIAVNGQAGDAQAMVKQIKETSILEMLIRKPEPAAPEPPVDFGVQRAGVFIPGLTPARVVDVLLDIRARAAEKKSSNEVPGGTAASKGGASAGGIGSEPPNHYQVLVLPMKVDDTEIKKSYRKLVLQWHPDKQPGNREEADVKIRLINSAYECLSNPLKRQSYDQMLAALERKRLGVRLETQFIKPRMSIPKEFMLCPLGSTDRFVRVVKDKLVVQSREEAAGVSFQDFFQGAKFSLWWLPEVNNMCRLRARETAGSGVDGGMNVSFAFDGGKEDDHDAEADTALTPSQDMRKCNLMVIPSPFSAGAFRFEGAFFPGRMLSFRSPNKLLMAGKADEGSDIADFVLVDYSAAYKFMTTSEVLKGACESQGGKNGEYVKLSDLRADLSVRLYFQQMLGCAVWNNKDFETFFEGHYEEWDFILSKAKVRIRPGGPLDRKVEEPESSAADEPMPEAPAKETEEPSRGADAGSLGEKLRTAGSQMGIVKVLMAAAGDDLAKLPVSTVGPTLQRLGEKAGSGKASDKEDLTAARRRFLLALPLVLGEAANSGSSRARGRGSSTLETGVSISHLLGMKKAVANIAANDQAPDLAKVCQSATESIADVVGSRVRQAPEEVGLDILSDIFALPMNWRSVASSLADAISPLLKKQGPGALLPALRAGSKLPKDARPVLEALARAELKNVGFADAAVAANVLLTIAEAGVEGEGVASRLRPPLLQRVALPDLVSIVAALGEKRLEADLLRPALQARVAVAGPALAAVPPANLLRLAKASTRSPVVAECALGPVAGAAATSLAHWPAESVAELLLVVATTSTGEGQMVSSSSGAKKLFGRVEEVLVPMLAKLEVPILLKVVVGSGAVASQCRGLLESAAQRAVARLPEMRPDQAMLLTQGALPLGATHQCVTKLLAYWAQELSGVGSGPVGGADEAKADESRSLPPDDLAHLAMLLSLVAPNNTVLFQTIGLRLIEGTLRITDAGRTSLEAAFPGGAGPNFTGKEEFLATVAANKKVKKAKVPRGDRSRSRSRETRRRASGEESGAVR